MLDAALDAVAAADVHILVHAHGIERHAEGARDLVGVLRHLDRGPHVEHLPPGVPARHHAERLDRHGGAAAPVDAIAEVCGAARNPRRHRPRRRAVEQHVGAMRRHAPACCPACTRPRRRARTAAARIRRDFLARILGQRAAVGHDRGDPFARIAREVDRQRIAPHLRRIEADQQRHRWRRQAPRPVDHVVHARHRQRRRPSMDTMRAQAYGEVTKATCSVPGGSCRRRSGLAADEAAVLAHPAVARDET